MTKARQWRVFFYFSRNFEKFIVGHFSFCMTFVSTIFAPKKGFFSPCHTFVSTNLAVFGNKMYIKFCIKSKIQSKIKYPNSIV